LGAVFVAADVAPRRRPLSARVLAAALIFACLARTTAHAEPAADPPAAAAGAAPASDAGPAAAARDYYVRPRGYRVVPETDPPRYVRDAAKTGFRLLETLDWLQLGAEERMRFEIRENSLLETPQTGTDYPVLSRFRLFLGIKKILDPFRMAIEFQDSRWENHLYPSTNRQVNEREPIQMYGELYFDDALGSGRPLYVRGGRMAFELLDRRLVANNEFRNTSNTFQGVRAKWGEPTNDWEFDLLALQPIDRLLYAFDAVFPGLWFYGTVGSVRRWSEIATVQPYWLGLTQSVTDENPDPNDKFNIHTTGVRAYGIVNGTPWDWDVDVAYQFGKWTNDQIQNAWASALELGYTIERSFLKPRFSAFFGYGSGDRDPNDDQNNSFNALYGFNQPWSRNDYFSWDNAIQPKARLELNPSKDLLIDMGYGAFWLASSKAPWVRVRLFDPTGRSGNWLGSEYDIRLRYRFWGRITTELSYSRFDPGTFPTKLGKGLASNFFYFQLTLSAFE